MITFSRQFNIFSIKDIEIGQTLCSFCSKWEQKALYTYISLCMYNLCTSYNFRLTYNIVHLFLHVYFDSHTWKVCTYICRHIYVGIVFSALVTENKIFFNENWCAASISFIIHSFINYYQCNTRKSVYQLWVSQKNWKKKRTRTNTHLHTPKIFICL